MIALEGVHHSFGGEVVLDSIDLRIGRGEVFGLMGPGSSGKSVLLKLICGLFRPYGGRILFEGEDLATASEERLLELRARIGMLFQNHALFDFLTVGENVAFPLIEGRHHVADAKDESNFDEIITRTVADHLRAVGLGGWEERHPSELSGGMRKRVGLARALVTRPQLLICDEPTAGLDPVTSSKIYSLLARQQEQTGATMIIVSSDIDALRRAVPRVAMLHRGRLLYDGPSADVETADHPFVRQFVRGALEETP